MVKDINATPVFALCLLQRLVLKKAFIIDALPLASLQGRFYHLRRGDLSSHGADRERKIKIPLLK